MEPRGAQWQQGGRTQKEHLLQRRNILAHICLGTWFPQPGLNHTHLLVNLPLPSVAIVPSSATSFVSSCSLTPGMDLWTQNFLQEGCQVLPLLCVQDVAESGPMLAL